MIPGAADRHWRAPDWQDWADRALDEYDGLDVGRGDLGGETDVLRVVAPSAPGRGRVVSAANTMAAYADGLRDGQRFTEQELRIIAGALELSQALQDKLGTPESAARCERTLAKVTRILEAM